MLRTSVQPDGGVMVAVEPTDTPASMKSPLTTPVGLFIRRLVTLALPELALDAARNPIAVPVPWIEKL